jgi:hypothetical protein
LSDASPEVRAEAEREIKKYGRFSEPILKRLLEQESDAALRARIGKLIAADGAATE